MIEKNKKKLKNDNEIKGIILAILAAIISGFAIPINKIFVVSLDPLIFTTLRSILVGLFFFILISFKTNFNFAQFKKFSWKYLIAIATIGGSLSFFLFFSGLKLTTSARAAFLHKTLPLYVIIFAYIFLKEKITRKQVFAVMLMFIGLIMINYAEISPAEFWSNPKIGDLLVILATMLWALENIISKRAMIKGEHNLVISFSRMFFGGLILFFAIILTGNLEALFSIKQNQILNIFISTFILSLYVLFWYWSIRYINVSKAAPILLLSPIVSLILATLFFKEPLPPLQILGSSLILIGAYFVSKIRSEFA